MRPGAALVWGIYGCCHHAHTGPGFSAVWRSGGRLQRGPGTPAALTRAPHWAKLRSHTVLSVAMEALSLSGGEYSARWRPPELWKPKSHKGTHSSHSHRGPARHRRGAVQWSSGHLEALQQHPPPHGDCWHPSLSSQINTHQKAKRTRILERSQN